MHMCITFCYVFSDCHSLNLQHISNWISILIIFIIIKYSLQKDNYITQDANYRFKRFIHRLDIIIMFFFTRGTCNPSGFKKIRDNFFVLGWLLFDDVSAKRAMKSKCVETLDGNI